MNRILGIDFGLKRVGVAVSDPLGLTAQPLEVLKRSLAVQRIADLVDEYDVAIIVVGVPNSLDGGESESGRLAQRLGQEIVAATGREVVFIDERFTSRMAESALLESGMRREDRRQRVDKVAAAIILQSYLDGNSRATGNVGKDGAQ